MHRTLLNLLLKALYEVIHTKVITVVAQLHAQLYSDACRGCDMNFNMDRQQYLYLINKLQQRRQVAALAIVLLNCKNKKKSDRRKKIWVRKWLQKRNEGRGVLHMIQEEIRLQDPNSYKNYYRMDEDLFEELLTRIIPHIQKKDTVMREAITPRQRLAATLRFLASGNSFKDLSFALRIAPNTLSLIIPETLRALIFEFQDECIKCPNSEEEWAEIEIKFRTFWQFPHCIGALDGKHINFRPSKKSGSYYRNYKNRDSIILMGLVDATYKFLFVDIGRNGRMNDSAVFRDSKLAQHLNDGLLNFPEPSPLPGDQCIVPIPYVIVADDAFSLSTYLMKPYPERGLTHYQRIFNYRLSRARRIVENAFGILANRFRILLNTISLSVDKVELITLTCCILHNFILSRKPFLDNIAENNSEIDSQCHLNGLSRQGGNNPTRNAKAIRDHFMNYFNTTGSVPWQNEAVQKGNY